MINQYSIQHFYHLTHTTFKRRIIVVCEFSTNDNNIFMIRIKVKHHWLSIQCINFEKLRFHWFLTFISNVVFDRRSNFSFAMIITLESFSFENLLTIVVFDFINKFNIYRFQFNNVFQIFLILKRQAFFANEDFAIEKMKHLFREQQFFFQTFIFKKSTLFSFFFVFCTFFRTSFAFRCL